jgi:hypothetical protein
VDLKALVIVNVHVFFLSGRKQRLIVEKGDVSHGFLDLDLTGQFSCHPVAQRKMTATPS